MTESVPKFTLESFLKELQENYKVHIDVFPQSDTVGIRTRGGPLKPELKNKLKEQIRLEERKIVSWFADHPEVVALGALELGPEMELVESLEPVPVLPTESMYLPQVAFGTREFDRPLEGWDAGGLPRQKVTRKLQPAEPRKQLRITDKGLTAAYCIIGVPGSGKSFLYEYLLRQIIAYRKDQPDLKYGCLILDPKVSLIEKVRAMAVAAGRQEDLIVLNAHEMANAKDKQRQSVNILSCGIAPAALGKQLALAGLSCGGAASDPYWFGAWSNLFFGAVLLLTWHEEFALTVPTLLACMDRDRANEPKILELARKWKNRKKPTSEVTTEMLKNKQIDIEDLDIAADSVLNFYAGLDNGANKDNTPIVIYNLMLRSLGSLRLATNARFSRKEDINVEIQRRIERKTFYDEIIQDGKIVLISVDSEDIPSQKALCTLVKCLFQQKVQGRLARYQEAKGKSDETQGSNHENKKTARPYNFRRPLLLACDEYDKVASEIPGEAFGDGTFFSICREMGCMGLMATQSVNNLKKTSLGEHWPVVFGNVNKIVMRLGDRQTLDEITALAGKEDWYVTSQTISMENNSASTSENTSMTQRDILYGIDLTTLDQGSAVVMGSLDGSKRAGTRFLRVGETKQN